MILKSHTQYLQPLADNIGAFEITGGSRLLAGGDQLLDLIPILGTAQECLVGPEIEIEAENSPEIADG